MLQGLLRTKDTRKLNNTLIIGLISDEPAVRKLSQNRVKKGGLPPCQNPYIQIVKEIITTPLTLTPFCSKQYRKKRKDP